MVPTISSEDTKNTKSSTSATTETKTIDKMSPMLSSSPPSALSSSLPSSISQYISERGTETKSHFGFLKKRLTEGSLHRSSSSSVRPTPEEAGKWANSFNDLMNSKYGQALFKAFLGREFSEENIEFWLAVEDYHKTGSHSKLAIKAQKILNEFIIEKSPKEINLDSLTRDNLVALMSNQPPTLTTFDQAQKRTQSLLEADAYQRFLKSDLYMELLYPEQYSQDLSD